MEMYELGHPFYNLASEKRELIKNICKYGGSLHRFYTGSFHLYKSEFHSVSVHESLAFNLIDIGAIELTIDRPNSSFRITQIWTITDKYKPFKTRT